MNRQIIKRSVCGLSITLFVLLSACTSLPDKARDVLSLNVNAETAYREGRCEQAVQLYRRVADSLPQDTHSLLRIGNCYARLQREDRAMEAYREAIQRDRTFVKAWYNLSYLQAQSLAKTVAEMSANTDPSDPNLAYARRLAKSVLDAFNAEQQSALQRAQSQASPTDESASP